MKNNRTHTPLHCASIEGYGTIIEALVGYGADLNATDMEDNTALHILLIKKVGKPPNEDLTPQIMKVSCKFKSRNVIIIIQKLEQRDGEKERGKEKEKERERDRQTDRQTLRRGKEREGGGGGGEKLKAGKGGHKVKLLKEREISVKKIITSMYTNPYINFNHEYA